MANVTSMYVPLRVKRKHGTPDFAKTVIAARYEDCTQKFTRLCEAFSSQFEEETAANLANALAMLINWGNDTGALEKELDHKLRDATDLRKLVIDLLTELQTLLDNAHELLESESWQSPLQALPEDFDEPEEREIGPDEDAPPQSTNSELVHVAIGMFASVNDYVDNLNALKPSLERPWSQAVDEYCSSSENGDQADRALAKQLFPYASNTLRARLGRANYRRKMAQKAAQLRIQQMGSIARRKHPKAEKKNIRPAVAEDAFNFQRPTLRTAPAPEASSGQHLREAARLHGQGTNSFLPLSPLPDRSLPARPVPAAAAAAGPPSEPETESEITSIFSKNVLPRPCSMTSINTYTSFAKSTAARQAAVASAGTTLINMVPDFPKLPIQLGDVPAGQTQFFTCTLCGHDLEAGRQIKTEEDWKQHVFNDLEPYLCTFDDCYSTQEMYAIKEEWYRHELETHRIKKAWACAACANEFPTRALAECHMDETHSDLDEEEIFVMKRLLRKRLSSRPLNTQDCPLCLDRLSAGDAKSHIGRHLELFALLSVKGEESSEEDDTDEAFSRTEDDLMSERGRKEEVLNTFVKEQFKFNLDRGPPDRFLEGGSGSELFEDMSEHGDSRDSGSRTGGRREEGRSLLMDRMFAGTSRQTEATGARREGGIRQYTEAPHVEPSQVSSADKLPLLRTGTNPRDDSFMGRDKELVNLYKILSEKGRVCVVSGDGGMGKTALAAEFTWRFEQAYHYIFWVQAETPVGSSDTFCQIAVQLGLAPEATDADTLIRLGREFLENAREKRWLVVFDNVERWEDIDIYTPRQTSITNGSILITTRHETLTAPSRPVNYFRIALQELEPDEGRKLLIHGLPPELRPAEASLRDPDYKIAGEIASLAGLPLLILLIAGYIKKSDCTLAEFWEYWDEWRPKRLVPGARSTGSDSGDSVLSLALRDLSEDARKVLAIMAFFDSDGIQRGLLVRQDPTKPGPVYLRVTRFRTIISSLTSQRFVSETKNKNTGLETYQVHRVVQTRLLRDMNANASYRDEIFRAAFDLLRYRLPRPSRETPDMDNWNISKDYLPHVLSLQKAYADPLSITTPTPFVGLAELFKDGGVILWQRYIYNDALRLLRTAETILVKLDSAEEELRTEINITIILLLQYFGITHRQESKDRLSQVLEYRKRVMERKGNSASREDHIKLNNAEADYANAVLQFNDFKTAEPIYEACYRRYLELATEADPADAFALAKLKHHLAYCRMYRGRFAEAINLSAEAVALVGKLGDQQMTLRYQFDLACIVLQSGDRERALSMHRDILQGRLGLQGRASYFSMQSQYAYAAICHFVGRLDEAEQWLRLALSRANERGGKNFWPDAAVARAKYHLSRVLRDKAAAAGDEPPKEAEKLSFEAKDVLSRMLPYDPGPVTGSDEEDTGALFDHLQPVFGGRFTGNSLLRYVGSVETGGDASA